MLSSVLVPLDGSPTGEWCLPLAVGIARSAGARLHLAHVHIPPDPSELLGHTAFQPEDGDPAEYEGKRAARDAEYLRRWEARLSGEGAAVDTKVIEGTPIADELAGYAQEVGADLIVMSSRVRPGLVRALLGSVADEVIRKAARPVLVVHPDEEQGVVGAPPSVDHVLVALDGSPLAEAVLTSAGELARATGARLTLLRVLPDPTYLGPRVTGLRPDRFEPHREGAQEYLDAMARRLAGEGLQVDTLVADTDRPAVAIARIAAARDADVIAVATHGHGGVKRAVLGSVTDELLKRSRHPLLVVRPAGDA